MIPSRWVRITILFLVLVAFYGGTRQLRISKDAHLNSLQTRALVLHGDIDLSRYGPQEGFAVRHGGDRYSIYGVGVSLLAAPLYAVGVRAGASESLLHAAATIPFAAGAVVVLYLLLLRLFGPRVATAGALTFAFGTSMWTLATTAFWMHAQVAFLVTVGLSAMFSPHRRAPALTGFAFGMAAFVRPPLAIVGLTGLSFYAAHAIVSKRPFREGLRAVVLYLGGGALPALAVFAQNRWIWGSWLRSGYTFADVGFHGDLAQGLWGELFGWWRGLSVYSPVFLVAVAGWIVALGGREFLESRFTFLGGACLTSILFYGTWETWWGGEHQFGYRYLLDVVPLLVLLSAYAVVSVRKLAYLALPLAAVSIATFAFGSLPDAFWWDGNNFPTRFSDAPVSAAWEGFADDPWGGLFRLALVSVLGWLFYALRPAPRRARSDPATTPFGPPSQAAGHDGDGGDQGDPVADPLGGR